jgi:spore coat polysaccharide biosynthesis predicted glycosyltransferase SpsG
MKSLHVYLSVAYGGAKGGGHLARVRKYLEALSLRIPVELTLIIDVDSSALLQVTHSSWQQRFIGVHYITARELMSGRTSVAVKEIDILIIDRFHQSTSLLALASSCKKVVVISDNTDNPYLSVAGLLIDFNYGAEHLESLYREQVPSECKLLLGWQYAPIEPNSISTPKDHQARGRRTYQPKELLITMGAEDPLCFTEKALNALNGSNLAGGVTNIKVIQGPLFNRNLSDDNPLPITIIRAPESLQPYYAEADLCISTGGVSTWERLSAQLPTRLVPYSKLQRKILMPMHEQGLIQLFPDFKSLCSESMNRLKLIEQIGAMRRIDLSTKSEKVITCMMHP